MIGRLAAGLIGATAAGLAGAGAQDFELGCHAADTELALAGTVVRRIAISPFESVAGAGLIGFDTDLGAFTNDYGCGVEAAAGRCRLTDDAGQVWLSRKGDGWRLELRGTPQFVAFAPDDTMLAMDMSQPLEPPLVVELLPAAEESCAFVRVIE